PGRRARRDGHRRRRLQLRVAGPAPPRTRRHVRLRDRPAGRGGQGAAPRRRLRAARHDAARRGAAVPPGPPGGRQRRHGSRRRRADARQRRCLLRPGAGEPVGGAARRGAARPRGAGARRGRCGQPAGGGATVIIDAHHHLWDVSRRAYPWLEPPALAPIRRTFTLADLRARTAAVGVDATVLVQTVSDVAETREFLTTAAASDGLIRGVVGWVDLTDPAVDACLADLRAAPGGRRLVGIRHQAQDEPDPGWLARDDVIRGLRAVAAAGLVYDLLVLPHQLPAARAAVEQVP